MNEFTLGCDVSIWQDFNSTPQQVDFVKMRSAGAEFVFIKASQSTWLDQDFVYNWHAARLAGLARGAYHYLTWDKPAIDQARFLAGVLRGDAGELPVVLDYECRKGAPVLNTALQQVRIFVEAISCLLETPVMIYTSPSYWGEFGSPRATWAAQYPLWIAHYGVTKPKVPAPWKAWKFWQYTDRGSGLEFGAESKQIDLNWYCGTLSQFEEEFGGSPPSPDPIPDPNPTRMVTITAVLGLRVREEPNTSSRILKTLRYGEKVLIFDQPGTWLKLADRPGWIHSGWVR